jgi:hypothetical protein
MSAVIETEPCGLLFDFDNPRPEQVDIRDIARALSLSCRFGGLCTEFYSVAEHAVLVYDLVKNAGGSPELCYAALHHDSHEAYLGDVVTPLKKKLGPAWEWLQAEVDEAICVKLDIHFFLMRHPAIKEADAEALLIEASALKSSEGVGPQWKNDTPAHVPSWACQRHYPWEAEERFLRVHEHARAACSR